MAQQLQAQQQKVQFANQRVENFDVNYDCTTRKVVVTSRGADRKSATFPIASDGSFSGKGSRDLNRTGITDPTASPTPDADPKTLTIQTDIDFRQATPDEVDQAVMGNNDGGNTGGTASTDTSTDTGTRTGTGAQPAPSPSPSPSPSPTPSPSATVTPTPVKICLVDEKTCGVTGKVETTRP